MSNQFVHLHVHTSYSLLDGACRLDDLIDSVVDDDMPAVAITDHGVMYGVVDFYRKAHKRGIKPILGCEAYVARGSRLQRTRENRAATPHHLVLLAENELGYANLVKLISLAHLEGYYYKPRIDKELLAANHEGLIGLSGCWQGEVANCLLNDNREGALSAARDYADILGRDNFFIEVQDQGMDGQDGVNRQLVGIADELDLRVVATNDVHYLKGEHASAHDVLLCMQTQTVLSDPKRMHLPTKEFYFKTSEQMARLFGDVPGAVEASVEIAHRCEVELKFGSLHFPAFDVPGGRSARACLLDLCAKGMAERCGIGNIESPESEDDKRVVERLRYELKIIEKTGFVNYYLVVWDFVNFARQHDIPVGLRGSGGASLVAYAIGITDINPMKYSLVFERFLNPERVSPPDFDIDFCQARRGEVIEYVKEKYGRENVAQIITFGSLGAKQVIRDVGRALEISYGECDRLSKMVPDDPKITLRQALEKSAELRGEYDLQGTCREILDYGFVLEGLSRNAGTHAAGVVIGEKPLIELVPLARDKDKEIITQYAMDSLSEIGLLKLDLLGLRTLTVMHEAIEMIGETRGVNIELERIPADDAATFDLLNRGDTVGVFQLESSGMRDLIRRVGIDKIEDLIAMIALYRPGPMNMLEDYVRRKTGKAEVKHQHELLESVLAETYGVTVYQEQVQQAAHILAGYSLGQGDLLRRAMSKKDAGSMEQQRAQFIAGAKKTNHISKKVAGEIFDTLAKFAAYGFNKSHSTAYAVVSYRTAYLKANYPAEFMAALLSSEMRNSEKLRVFIEEAKKMGLEVLPPHVNGSSARFRASENAIRFGMVGIKNVGEAAVAAMVAEREQSGSYSGLLEFCSRLDSRLVNRKTIESLVRSGCFDGLSVHRRQLFDGIDLAVSRAAEAERDRASGQGNLFEALDGESVRDEDVLRSVEPWHESELLAAEKELLGFYISGHPLSEYVPLLKRYHLGDLSEVVAGEDGDSVRIGGIISRIDRKLTKRGRNMVVLDMECLDGTVEVVVFPDVYDLHAANVQDSAAVWVQGKLSQGDAPAIHASGVHPLDHAPAKLAERISIHLAASHLEEGKLEQVKAILSEHPGPVPVVMCVLLPGGEKVFVEADDIFKVSPGEKLIDEVERILGEKTVYVAVSSSS